MLGNSNINTLHTPSRQQIVINNFKVERSWLIYFLIFPYFAYSYMTYTKIWIKRGNSYQKNKEISRWEVQLNTWRLNWYISTLSEVFLNQKRINVFEQTAKWHHMTNIYTFTLSDSKILLQTFRVDPSLQNKGGGSSIHTYWLMYTRYVLPIYVCVICTSVLSFSTWSLSYMILFIHWYSKLPSISYSLKLSDSLNWLQNRKAIINTCYKNDKNMFSDLFFPAAVSHIPIQSNYSLLRIF